VGLDIGAVRGELVLAIYEVGQCFFHGWGVKKDQRMAVVSYPLRSYMRFSLLELNMCGRCRRALSLSIGFSLISKLRRSSAMRMHSRSWHSAMQMVVGARRTAKRPPSGIAQL
jgi:hypothetical protein